MPRVERCRVQAPWRSSSVRSWTHFQRLRRLCQIPSRARQCGIAKETETQVGNLTIISTHATIDQPEGATRQDVLDLIERCQQPPVATKSAA